MSVDKRCTCIQVYSMSHAFTVITANSNPGGMRQLIIFRFISLDLPYVKYLINLFLATNLIILNLFLATNLIITYIFLPI